MIIDILDLLADLVFDDAVHLRMLARFAWPRVRGLARGWLRLVGVAVLDQIEAGQNTAADRQLLAQLRRCA